MFTLRLNKTLTYYVGYFHNSFVSTNSCALCLTDGRSIWNDENSKSINELFTGAGPRPHQAFFILIDDQRHFTLRLNIFNATLPAKTHLTNVRTTRRISDHDIVQMQWTVNRVYSLAAKWCRYISTLDSYQIETEFVGNRDSETVGHVGVSSHGHRTSCSDRCLIPYLVQQPWWGELPACNSFPNLSACAKICTPM